MNKIEKLTAEQETLLPVYTDKWLKIGLSTEPCDRSLAEKAVKEAYLIAELKPPEKFVWCDSPLSLVITDNLLKNKSKDSVRDSVWDSVWASIRASVRDSVSDSVWASVSDSVWASIRASVRDSVWASIRDSVWASIRDSVSDSVWASVSDSVRDSVWASIRDSVRDSVWASVSDSVSDSVWNSVSDSVRDSVWNSVWASIRASVSDSVWASVSDSVYGSQDAYWLSFYNFFLEVLNVNEVKKLKPLMDLAKNCGWWIPRENICILSEKPVKCNLLEGVLHSEDSPAVAYKDGFCIWAINGVKVDEQIVLHPKTQTLEQINAEENEEIKRVRIERYGWTDYLQQSDAEVIETKIIRLNSGTTWMESLMQLNDIKVLCTYDPSTGRPYALEVDPKCKTCQDAQHYLQAPEEAFSGFSFRPTETYPVLRT